jgi:hypothetical protein
MILCGMAILLLLALPFLLAASGDPLIELLPSLVSGDGRTIAAGMLSLLVFALASARDRVAWLRGDRGGVVFVFALALIGALIAALRSDVRVTLALFVSAFEIALIAIGGYTGIRRFIWPKDAPVIDASTEAASPRA